MNKLFRNNDQDAAEPLRLGRILLIALMFALLIVVFFHEGFFGGKFIQGIDGNYSVRLVLHNNLVENLKGFWMDDYWLGRGSSWMLKTKLFFLRTVPLGWSLTTCFATMMLSAMTGMFLFLRRNGLSSWAGCFGALAYGLTPHYITLVYPCHIDSFNQMGYVPWIFLLLLIAMGKKTAGWKSWAAAVMAGLLWGMAMNEDVQRGLYISAVTVAYALYLFLRGLDTRPVQIKPAALNALKPVLAGILMLLVFANNFDKQMRGPMVQGKRGNSAEQVKQSEQEKWAFATSWSLDPRELGDSLAPGYHGMISGDPERPYWGSRPVAHSNDSLGFFVVVFALAGILAAFRNSGTVRFFSVAAVLATLLAFGEYLPGRPLFWLWYHLPMMAKMRAPVKFMCVTAFALSVLSAFGFQYLLEAVRAGDRRTLKRWLIAFGILLVGGLVCLMSSAMNESAILTEATRKIGHSALAAKAYGHAVGAVVRTVLFSLTGAVLIALILFAAKLRYMRQIVLAGFMAALVWDLYAIDRYYLKQTWFEPGEYYQADDAIRYLQQQPGEFRVCTSLKIMHQGRMVPLSLAGNRGMYITHLFPYFGINAMDNTPQARVSMDYNAFFAANLPGFPQARTPKELVTQLLNGQVDFWRLCNVEYVMTDGFLYGISQQPVPVADAMIAHPALELVHRGSGIGGRPIALFRVKGALPRFAVYAGSDPELLLDACTAAEVLEKGQTFVHLRVETDVDSTLVWSSRYDIGWRATIGGRPVSTFPIEDILLGMEIPAGEHDVELRYIPGRK